MTILYRLEGEPAVSGDLPFTDVEAGIWYTDAILWAAQNNIVNGVSDTEFAPGDDLTRQQLVTILYRYAEAKGYDVSASADLSGYPDAGQVPGLCPARYGLGGGREHHPGHGGWHPEARRQRLPGTDCHHSHAVL